MAAFVLFISRTSCINNAALTPIVLKKDTISKGDISRMELNHDKTSAPIAMCESSFIEEMKLAVEAERLPIQFTVSDIKQWVESDHITKPDGTLYQEISAELLLNYSRNTPITKKRKQKVLYTSKNSRFFSFNPF